MEKIHTAYQMESKILASEINGQIRGFLAEKGVLSKDQSLLMEAYRRKMMFHPERPLRGTWLGLGMPSRYKSEYFTTTDGKPARPRCNDWWVLTQKGIILMEWLILAVPFPAIGSELETALNENLFG